MTEMLELSCQKKEKKSRLVKAEKAAVIENHITEELLNNLILVAATITSICVSALVFMDKQARQKLFTFIKSKIKH